MAKPGEIEVFRISPKVDKCYEHIEATRSQYMGGGNHRYFSTNKPRYVGKFVKQMRQGYGNGGTVWDIFNQNGKENRVDYTYEGYTCFNEVPCKIELNSKAKNQALRNVYESTTGKSATPGNGPANLIRSYAGIKVPRGAEGGRRTRRIKNKKSKKTRSRK
jgi:hypothetical protein